MARKAEFMTEQEELKQFADECFTEAVKQMHESKTKAALDTALRAREIYTEINDRRKLASITNIISLIYDELGNAPLELQFQLDALEIAVDENAYDIAAKLYNNLGSKLLFSKSNERALYYFQQAIEMSEKAKAENMFEGNSLNDFELVINMNISTIYCLLGDFEKAKYHYGISKAASEREITEELFFPFITFEGLFFVKIGEPNKARELVSPIMELAAQNPYTTGFLEVYLDVIEMLRELNDFENLEKILHMMEAHLDEDSSIYMRVELMNQWIIFYKTVGREKEYLEACSKYYELSVEKAKIDTEREASTIEINAEVRRTMRAKKKADSMIYTDALTGIGNRAKMVADSKAMIEDSYNNHTWITIGLLDIDFFKESNDTYGHVVGDNCLKAVAKIISDAVGENGNVYRYGGDEFLILMQTKDVDLINSIGQTIKDKLAETKLRNERSPICPYVTISQGYTYAHAEKNDSIETLVPLADRVLYSVKRMGRNDYKFMYLNDILADL